MCKQFNKLLWRFFYAFTNTLRTEVSADVSILENCEPLYEELEGWSEDIRTVKRIESLPKAARKYIQFIELQTGVLVTMLSLGNRRDEVVILKNPFTD